jgi:DNA-damage-inducible protein J
MTKSAHLNARIEPRLKRDAERILAKVGLSTTDAVTIFYRQITLRRGLPFDVCIPNAETVAALDEIDAGGGRVYHGTGKEIVDAILRE